MIGKRRVSKLHYWLFKKYSRGLNIIRRVCYFSNWSNLASVLENITDFKINVIKNKHAYRKTEICNSSWRGETISSRYYTQLFPRSQRDKIYIYTVESKYLTLEGSKVFLTIIFSLRLRKKMFLWLTIQFKLTSMTSQPSVCLLFLLLAVLIDLEVLYKVIFSFFKSLCFLQRHHHLHMCTISKHLTS